MTASRLATLVIALLSSACCSKINSGGSGDTGCQLVGEWQGTLIFLVVNGLQLPPHMQQEVPGGMRVAFDREGHVTQTYNGMAATFARVGDEVMGGNPLGGTGVVFTFKVLKLTASANQVELHIKSYSGQAASMDPKDNKVFEKDGVAKFTYTLVGNQFEVRYEGTATPAGAPK